MLLPKWRHCIAGAVNGWGERINGERWGGGVDDGLIRVALEVVALWLRFLSSRWQWLALRFLRANYEGAL